MKIFGLIWGRFVGFGERVGVALGVYLLIFLGDMNLGFLSNGIGDREGCFLFFLFFFIRFLRKFYCIVFIRYF